jgi:hypothetical protein
MAVTIFLTQEAISANDAVTITASGFAALAIASDPERSKVAGIALDSAAEGALVRVNTDAVANTFTGLTPGQPQFLSPTTSGSVVDYTAWETDFNTSVVTGAFLTNIGKAVSSTALDIEIQRPIYVIK